VAFPTVAVSANLSPVTRSTGNVIVTLLALAFSTSFCTIFDPSSSYKEAPIYIIKIDKR
jgi:hypothetical protein